MKSLNLINYTINTLRKTVKEHPIKINFTLEFSFIRGEELTIIPTVTPPKTITHISEIIPKIQEIKQYTVDFITDQIEMKGSGWKFQFLQSFILHVFKYNPLQIRSYLPLPKEIQNKKCCINI